MRMRTVTSAFVVCAWLFAGNATASQASNKKDSSTYNERAAMLKQDMRTLWTDHERCGSQGRGVQKH